MPVYFTTASGNVWTTARIARPGTCCTFGRTAGFLYVADCKLASSENLTHIASRGGRFVTVLPRTYKEDGVFRTRLREIPRA